VPPPAGTRRRSAGPVSPPNRGHSCPWPSRPRSPAAW